MALKLKLAKTEFEKLSAELQAEYIEDGDEYRLDVSGIEDTGALRRAKDREVQLRKDADGQNYLRLFKQMQTVSAADPWNYPDKKQLATNQRIWSNLLTNASTVYPPTPPTPKTATREALSFCTASSPISNSVLEKRFNITAPPIKLFNLLF
jgi:hypothetical protein